VSGGDRSALERHDGGNVGGGGGANGHGTSRLRSPHYRFWWKISASVRRI
jgi:hypothetical protein